MDNAALGLKTAGWVAVAGGSDSGHGSAPAAIHDEKDLATAGGV